MDISARTERRTSRAVETGGADGHGSLRLRSVRAVFHSRLSEGDDYTAEASTRRGPEFWRDAAYSIRHTPCRYSLLTASVCRTGQLPDWPYGSNRQKRCPKSSATSIGLRTHTLATIADRISHSAKLYDEGNASGSKVVESRYEKQISKAAAEAQEHVPAHHRTQQVTR